MENPYLPPDIMVHIFHKLPIRYMLRWKLVCKEWNALLSDPFFKSKYDPSSNSNHPLLLMTISKWAAPAACYDIYGSGCGETMIRHHQRLPLYSTQQSGCEIMGSVNGLVALYHIHQGVFFLFNPCTGESKSVHVPVDWIARFACTELLCGLSYDSCRDEYKAVLSQSETRHNHFMVARFKEGGSKLKRRGAALIQPKISFCSCWSGNLGTIVNGLPHWIVYDGSSRYNLIMYFDQVNEELDELPRPDYWVKKKLCGVGALNGQLVVALLPEQADGTEIWTHQVYGDSESWTPLFVIMRKFYYVSPMLMMKNDEVLVDVVGARLVIYNYSKHTSRTLWRMEERRPYKIVTCMPSLVSPNSSLGKGKSSSVEIN